MVDSSPFPDDLLRYTVEGDEQFLIDSCLNVEALEELDFKVDVRQGSLD